MNPSESKGRCVPVTPGKDLVHTCRRPVGGDKTAQSPLYAFTVTNPDGTIWLQIMATEAREIFFDDDGFVIEL